MRNDAEILKEVLEAMQQISHRYAAFAHDRAACTLDDDCLRYAYCYEDRHLRCEIRVPHQQEPTGASLHVKCIDDGYERDYEWRGMEISVTKLLMSLVDGKSDDYAVRQMMVGEKRL